MNGRWSKKIRKETKQEITKIVNQVCEYSFVVRFRFALRILFAQKFGVKIKNG